MTAAEEREPSVPPPSSNGHGPEVRPAVDDPGFTGQHGKAAADGALRSTQADIDAAGGSGRRLAGRVASLRVVAIAALDRLRDSRGLLDHAVREAARTPVRYAVLSATMMLALTLFFFAGDTITLHLAFARANSSPLDAWLVPLAVSTPVVLGTRFIVRLLLDSISTPEAGSDRPDPAQPVPATSGSPADADSASLDERERSLDRRTEAVRRVKFRLLCALLTVGLLGLIGVAWGFFVLGGVVVGGDLLEDGLTFGGGAFIVGMLLLNTAGSGAVAAYGYTCGASEYAQVQRGVRRQGGQHVRLARFGPLRTYEAARTVLVVRMLRVDARKRAGRLEGQRRVFGAGDAAGIPPLAATQVRNLEVPQDPTPTRSLDEVLPRSLVRDDRPWHDGSPWADRADRGGGAGADPAGPAERSGPGEGVERQELATRPALHALSDEPLEGKETS